MIAGGDLIVCDFTKELSHVKSDSLGWLDDHLESLLENPKREVFCWLGGQPESEIWVYLNSLMEVLQNLLELRKPMGKQVAVLKHGPVASLGEVEN